MCLFRRQFGSNNTHVVHLSHDRLGTVIDFRAQFLQKRIADAKVGKPRWVAQPAVTFAIHNYHNWTIIAQNIKYLTGNLFI